MKYVEWFKHDNNARNDPKLQELRRKKGYGAKAIYWDLVEMLHEAGGVLPIEEAACAVSDLNHISNTTLAKYVICESDLFVVLDDGVTFSSKRLMEDITHAQKVKERRSEAGRESGKVRREKRVNEKNQTDVEQVLNKCSTNDEQQSLISSSLIITNNSVINNNEDSKVSNSKNITPEEFMDLWNNGRGTLPKVAALNKDRRNKAKLRIKEMGDTGDEQTSVMNKVMEKIRDSEFLSVKWGKCNFDWLIANSTNWLKIFEGNYDNRDIRSTVKDIRDIKNVNELWKD